ncbi:MAG TPA: transketolase [Egibacteraceae bacterium]|nr:transketolase [Egibacteraceae bacterium]
MTATVTGDEQLLERLRERALFARTETVRLISIAKTGHYSSAFSCAEILATLYYGHMRLKHGEPDWSERDRFLFGKGHAAVALYPFLADYGFFDHAVLDEYTRLGNPLGDHPDMRKVPGIDFSSGSLGHALSAGLGMVLGGRVQGLRYRVFVLLGDGELHEGQVWEAALSAAHHRAGNLVAIVDRNEYCLDGKVNDVINIEPVIDKWRAFGWESLEVDGHDVGALLEALRAVDDPDRDQPAVIVAHTVKGKGITYMEEEFGWHLGYLVPEDERDALEELRRGA